MRIRSKRAGLLLDGVLALGVLALSAVLLSLAGVTLWDIWEGVEQFLGW